MCELLSDSIIGFVSGCLSSVFVSIFSKIYWDKAEHKKQFKMDKQTYSRYIQNINLELLLACKSGDTEHLVRTIEDEPFRETFKNLSDESIVKVKEIKNYIEKLKEKALNEEISDKNYKVLHGELYRYSVWALTLTEESSKRKEKRIGGF